MKSHYLLITAVSIAWAFLPATCLANAENPVKIIMELGLNPDHLSSSTLEITHDLSTDIYVQYNPDLDPSSFAATLNGRDVTDLFRPKLHMQEVVSLPLSGGINRLQISGFVVRPDSKQETFTRELVEQHVQVEWNLEKAITTELKQVAPATGSP